MSKESVLPDEGSNPGYLALPTDAGRLTSCAVLLGDGTVAISHGHWGALGMLAFLPVLAPGSVDSEVPISQVDPEGVAVVLLFKDKDAVTRLRNRLDEVWESFPEPSPSKENP